MLDTIKNKLLSYNDSFNSQLKQDVLALVLTDFKRNGFFVEFGVCDGLYLSNTVLLEKQYDWQGIIAEPNKSHHESLIKNRSCNIDFKAVFGVSHQYVEFREIENHKDLSGIVETFVNDNHVKTREKEHKTYNVETISLTDLLRTYNAPTHIDFISIDTEGSEFDILSNFEFKDYDVDIFTVEHNFIERNRTRIKTLFDNNNYTRIFTELSQWDDWYISNKFLERIQ